METTIGTKILSRLLLSPDEAATVCEHLHRLEKTGTWEVPEWAKEIADYIGEVTAAHVAIQVAGWRAVAEAYRSAYHLGVRRE